MGVGEGRLLVSVAVTLEEAPLLARAAQAALLRSLRPMWSSETAEPVKRDGRLAGTR
jgi:hypothetical protein